MRICMFTNTYLPHVGGVAHSVSILARDLQQQGHQVLVIAPEYAAENRQQTDEIREVRLPAIQNFNGSDFSVRLPVPFVLDEKIEHFQPDIIHSHHPFLLGDSALRTAATYQLPLVFTHHTLYEQYTHYVPFDSDLMKRFVIQLSTKYANMCDRIIAPSQSVADLIVSRGVKRPVEAIPTGVDLDFFRQGDGPGFRKQFGLPETAFVFGHVGRLAPEKNLDYLARAMADCLARDEAAHFLVVGEGPSTKTMKKMFQSQKVPEKVIFAGKQSGPALRDAYHAMDTFVFSSFSETQGMVLMEAMAAGLPVIALDASGAREVVMERDNGRLLSGNTPAPQFSRAAREMISSADFRENCARQALATAARFSRESCARQVAELYHQARKNFSVASDKDPIDLPAWEGFLSRVNIEWQLLAQKARSIVNAMKPEET